MDFFLFEIFSSPCNNFMICFFYVNHCRHFFRKVIAHFTKVMRVISSHDHEDGWKMVVKMTRVEMNRILKWTFFAFFSCRYSRVESNSPRFSLWNFFTTFQPKDNLRCSWRVKKRSKIPTQSKVTQSHIFVPRVIELN